MAAVACLRRVPGLRGDDEGRYERMGAAVSLLPQNGEARRWRARVATWLVETARCIKRMEDIRE
jgi:hypothetical protein